MFVFVQFVMSIIFRKKLKEERLLLRSNTLNRAQSSSLYLFMKMCRIGVKEVKVNVFKCVNFMPGNLKGFEEQLWHHWGS